MVYVNKYFCFCLINAILLVNVGVFSQAHATLQTKTISEVLQDATVQVKRADKAVNDTSTAVVTTIEAKTNGFKELVNENITDFSGYVGEQYQNVTGYVDSQIQAGGEYLADQAQDAGEYLADQAQGAGEYLADSVGLSGEAGEGFSLTQDLGCLKEAVSKYSKYIKPAAQLASGDIFGAVSGVRDSFYTKTSDKLSGYSVSQVQKNLKKFVQEATQTAIGDSTQVMNGTSQFEKVQKSAQDNQNATASCKPTNVKEDINKTNSAGMTMNVMANTLLSLDITELSIQSATIYDNINSVSINGLLMKN